MTKIPTFCSNNAPIPSPLCNCGLDLNITYSNVPDHYVLKSQFNTLSLPTCFSMYSQSMNNNNPLSQFTNVYDNKGYIWWAATSQFYTPSIGISTGPYIPNITIPHLFGHTGGKTSIFTNYSNYTVTQQSNIGTIIFNNVQNYNKAMKILG